MTEQEDPLLTFPCQFPIKIAGTANPDFVVTISESIKKLDPSFDSKKIKVNFSKTGKYVSLTVIVHAQSKEHLNSVYQMLTKHPYVKFVL